MSHFLKRLRNAKQESKKSSLQFLTQEKSHGPIIQTPKSVSTLPENIAVREGTDCKKCGKEKKTLGIESMARALLSGKVGKEIEKKRIAQCEKCDHKDENGERLFRVIDGNPFCGAPRLGWKIYRDEKASGCGCLLTDKIKYKDAACPLGHWGPAQAAKT